MSQICFRSVKRIAIEWLLSRCVNHSSLARAAHDYELWITNYATDFLVGHLNMHIRKFANKQAEYAPCGDAAATHDVLEAQSAFHNLNHLI